MPEIKQFLGMEFAQNYSKTIQVTQMEFIHDLLLLNRLTDANSKSQHLWPSLEIIQPSKRTIICAAKLSFTAS